MPKATLVITIPSQSHKARGHLRSLRHGMLKGTANASCLLSQEKLHPPFAAIQAKQKLPPHVLERGQVRFSGGRACAAETNQFTSFGVMSCLSTHQSNLVAYRLPGGLGSRGSYDLTVLSIGQKGS